MLVRVPVNQLASRTCHAAQMNVLRTAIADLKSMHTAKSQLFDTTHPDLVHVMKGVAREHRSGCCHGNAPAQLMPHAINVR